MAYASPTTPKRTGALDAVKDFFSKAVPKRPKLTGSGLPVDEDDATLLQKLKDDEGAVIARTFKWLTDAQSAQYVRQWECVRNIAATTGGAGQWYQQKSDGTLRSMTEGQKDVLTTEDNQIKPIVVQNMSRCAGTLPDVSVAPLTDSQQDMAAADEAVSILTHRNAIIDRARLLQEKVYFAETCGAGIEKVWWDKTAYADFVTEVDPQTGAPTASERVMGGEVKHAVYSAIDLLIDPRANTIEESSWIAHLMSRAKEDVESEYDVKLNTEISGAGATAPIYQFLSLMQRLSNIAGDFNSKKSATGVGDAVVLVEVWVRPKKGDPDDPGALMTFAGSQMIRSEPWPYDDREHYPFFPCLMQSQPGTPWGDPLVSNLIPHQVAINRILTNADTQDANRKPMIIVSDAQTVKSDQFANPRTNQVIYVSPGPQDPKVFITPGNGEDRFALLKYHLERMQDIGGVHDVSQGEKTSGNESAAAIELRQNADVSKLKILLDNIERCEQLTAEYDLMLYRQFACSSPRMLGIDANDMPGGAASRMMRFEAFKAGACRAVVSPGSGWPKLPAAKMEQEERWYELGVYGPPGSSAASETFLEQQELISSSEIIPRAVARIKEAEASAPSPLAIQQMKNQGAIQLINAKATADASAKGQSSAIEQQTEIEKERELNIYETQRLAYQHAAEEQQLVLQHQYDMQKLLTQQSTGSQPKLSMQADPVATAAYERMIGLPAADPSKMMPPPPVSEGGKGDS